MVCLFAIWALGSDVDALLEFIKALLSWVTTTADGAGLFEIAALLVMPIALAPEAPEGFWMVGGGGISSPVSSIDFGRDGANESGKD